VSIAAWWSSLGTTMQLSGAVLLVRSVAWAATGASGQGE
jgi:hypothetical protein